MSDQETAARPDFSACITDANGKLGDHWRTLIRLGWAPILITQAIGLALTRGDPNASLALQLAANIITTVGYAVFAVAAHRLFILGEAPGGFFHIRFQRTEALFFIFVFALGIVLFIPATMLGALAAAQPDLVVVTVPLLAVLIVVAVYLGVRLSLALPDIAVESRLSLGAAWRATRGLFLPMFLRQLAIVLMWAVILVIVGVAATLVALPLAGVFGLSGERMGQIVGGLAGAVVYFGLTGHSVALLSVFYERTRERWTALAAG